MSRTHRTMLIPMATSAAVHSCRHWVSRTPVERASMREHCASARGCGGSVRSLVQDFLKQIEEKRAMFVYAGVTNLMRAQSRAVGIGNLWLSGARRVMTK